MNEQALHIRRNPAKAWALHATWQIEVALQSTSGQLDTSKNPFLPAEANRCLDWREDDRPGGLNNVGKCVEERSRRGWLALQMIFHRRRPADMPLALSLKVPHADGADSCAQRWI